MFCPVWQTICIAIIRKQAWDSQRKCQKSHSIKKPFCSISSPKKPTSLSIPVSIPGFSSGHLFSLNSIMFGQNNVFFRKSPFLPLRFVFYLYTSVELERLAHPNGVAAVMWVVQAVHLVKKVLHCKLLSARVFQLTYLFTSILPSFYLGFLCSLPSSLL